jgi:hypothetical protein
MWSSNGWESALQLGDALALIENICFVALPRV